MVGGKSILITSDHYQLMSKHFHSFISISLGELKIIGFPTCIENRIYNRNAYYYNLCFVFEEMTSTACYESIIKKTTEYLVSLITIRDKEQVPAVKNLFSVAKKIVHLH
jgi:Nitrogen permease regulator 2